VETAAVQAHRLHMALIEAAAVLQRPDAGDCRMLNVSRAHSDTRQAQSLGSPQVCNWDHCSQAPRVRLLKSFVTAALR